MIIDFFNRTVAPTPRYNNILFPLLSIGFFVLRGFRTGLCALPHRVLVLIYLFIYFMSFSLVVAEGVVRIVVNKFILSILYYGLWVGCLLAGALIGYLLDFLPYGALAGFVAGIAAVGITATLVDRRQNT